MTLADAAPAHRTIVPAPALWCQRRLALRRGFRGTFVDLELGVWEAFHTRSYPGNNS